MHERTQRDRLCVMAVEHTSMAGSVEAPQEKRSEVSWMKENELIMRKRKTCEDKEIQRWQVRWRGHSARKRNRHKWRDRGERGEREGREERREGQVGETATREGIGLVHAKYRVSYRQFQLCKQKTTGTTAKKARDRERASEKSQKGNLKKRELPVGM